jgi:hypothetical protein
MTKLRLVLILILAGSILAIGYQRYRDHLYVVEGNEAANAVRKRIAEYQLAAKRAKSRSEQQFIDQSAVSAIPHAYPRPLSDWTTNEKLFYEKLLTGRQYDVLVAPMQVNGWAFDRASRSLMSAELTAAIAKGQPGRVPDAYLVAKALGDGQRQFPLEDLYRIARSVGAKRIIWGAVGHDLTGKMTITILSQLRPKVVTDDAKWVTPISAKSINDIPFDDEHSAIEAFELRIPEILQALDIQPAAPAPEKIASRLDIARLPPSPLNLITGDDNPAREAYAFLLFGSLSPEHIERTKERFVEKALRAISLISVASPEYRALHARAYMMMGYRAAALKVLGTAASGEEQEIRAALDGNLPEVRAQASKEANQLKRLLEELDANRISVDYGVLTSIQSVDAVKALKLPGQIWPFLATRAFTDWDSWSQFDNAPLKMLIEHELPVKGYTLEELVRGAVSVGDTEQVQTTMDLSVFNHVHRYVQDHAAQCCDPSSTRFGDLDYLELLSALGHDNLIRRIEFFTTIQRAPRDAIRFADAIQSVYKGYPYYALVRSEAERQEADESGDAERDGLMKAAYENVFNAMYWEQSQSRISSRALTDLGSRFRLHEYGYFDNFYYTEVPYHAGYMIWANGGNPSTMRVNGLASLGNATSQFGVVSELVGGERAKFVDQSLVDDVVRQIQGRFIGSPARGEFLADQEILHGNPGAAALLLREDIKIAPAYRDAYFALGALTLESGQAREAARIFLSYPGLHQDSKTNRVSAANAAYDMGSYFFKSGDFDLAIPFYTLATSQGTGAGSEMAAAMRLDLLAGDINGAMLSSLERGRRYHDSRAYRDYLGMLHATKHSEAAWSGFGTLVRELREPHIWESALVGHHVGGSSEAEVTEWVKQSEFRGVGNHVSYAITYLARFATTDRIPSKELPSVIADLDRPTWQFDEGAHSVVRPDADGRDQQILGPVGAITPQGVLPIGAFERGGPKHRVRSELSYFVEAYRAIKLREFSEAKRVFDEAATLYDMASAQSTYMLPYYALASAEAGGDVSNVETILGRITPKEQRFDYQLAKAMLEGVDGKIGEALVSLKLARYRRPSTEERIQLTQFTYGDICESLYQVTGSPEIRRVALDWARSSEKAEPWQSWSYALEATLTPDSLDRKRAIAMAFYLDPKSTRLSSLKKSEIDDAVRAFASANIFLRAERGERKGTTT